MISSASWKEVTLDGGGPHVRTCVLTASTENRLREGGVRTEGPRTARVPRSGDRPGTEWGTIATCSYADSGARLLVREARSALCASSRPVHLLRTVRQVQDAVCLTEALLGDVRPGEAAAVDGECEGARASQGVPSAQRRPCPDRALCRRAGAFPSCSSGAGMACHSAAPVGTCSVCGC